MPVIMLPVCHPYTYRLLFILVMLFCNGNADIKCKQKSDVVIWGGTVCGVTATVAVTRTDPNIKVIWLVNGTLLGGMTSGGLSGEDLQMPIGGIAKELLEPLGHNFEPHIAEETIENLTKKAGDAVTLYRNTGWLTSVQTNGTAPRRIISVATMSGLIVCGKVWIDCSYEGDLLRLSGTDFALGREAISDYNESLAGSDGPMHPRHGVDQTPSMFANDISPFVNSSNTTLLPGILGFESHKSPGSSDDWVQSYCFRLCLTNIKKNAINISAPSGYTSAHLELLRRQIASQTHNGIKLSMNDIFLIRHLPNNKIDLNSGQFNIAPFSTDAPFLQHDWPTGNATMRARIFAKHKWWTQAILYFLAHDQQIKKMQPALATTVRSFGLCKDEFNKTGNWPPQLYVRESIRLRGSRILTQHNVAGDTAVGTAGSWASSIGLSRWGVDIHAVQRVVVNISDNLVIVNAGGHDTFKSKDPPQKIALVEIPYEVITPRLNDTSNLLVPVCASFTHVAFSTYRLEPQYAIFGHSAGTAAALAIQENTSVQTVDITNLQDVLSSQAQIINRSNTTPQIILRPCNNITQQKWVFLKSDTTIRLLYENSNTCASVYGYSRQMGEAVWVAKCHTSDKSPAHQNQEFDLIPQGQNGAVKIRNSYSKLCIGGKNNKMYQLSCNSSQTIWDIMVSNDAITGQWKLLDESNLCATAP